MSTDVARGVLVFSMRILTGAGLTATALMMLLGVSRTYSQDASSCGHSDWFAVRQDRLRGKVLSALCKAELDAGEDRRALAETELNAIVKAAPDSDRAYAAHSTLSHFYLRIGRFHDAEAQISAMLAARPNAPDLANIRSLFALLAAHPDMSVAGDHTSSIHTHEIEGNIFASVSVNGSPRSYMLDTGMDLSFMSESEAAHLGLKPESSTTRMNDISGRAGSELRLVVVDDLVIGATHLRHVPFLVMSDTNGAFAGVPSDQRGVIGIQAILGLGKLSFQAHEMLTINGKSAPSNTTAPIMFVGTLPITQVAYRGRPITVTLDTGATQTTLNPPFSTLFPDLVRGQRPQSHDMNGLAGTTAQRSVTVPRLAIKFGREVELAPAIILLDQTTGASAWSSANLGYDLIRQAEPFTLDFRRMKFEFNTRN